MAIFGNSLTEGFSVTTAQKFGSLLAAQLGEDQVAISGVGGADTRGLINRAFVELDGLRPKVVIFEAGANPGDGADFSENLLILRRIARNAGAEVMFATPTGDAGRAAAVQALDGVTVLNFGAAVTSAGPGSSVVEGYFSGTRPDDDEPFMDSTHWNADGHQRQLGKLALDARAIVAVAAQQ